MPLEVGLTECLTKFGIVGKNGQKMTNAQQKYCTLQ